MNYVMSRTEPVITPSHRTDFYKEVGDMPDSDYPDDGSPSRTPECRLWAQHVARTLGFSVIESYPTAFDESGCFILHRRELDPEPDNRAREFEYIAILAVSYENEIVVGIPDAAAYLQFHRLVQPLLTMQADARFHDDRDFDGRWENGRNFQDIYQSLLAGHKRACQKRTQQ
jgi:hypothetical protein